MDKDCLNILIFDHITFGARCLRVPKETFKILFCLLLFFHLSFIFFLCDYIQVKKKQFNLNQLRQESLDQKSQIQLFSAKIEELEKKLSKLKDFDRRIRIVANLERGHEVTPFIGLGGPPPVITWKLKEESKGSE